MRKFSDFFGIAFFKFLEFFFPSEDSAFFVLNALGFEMKSREKNSRGGESESAQDKKGKKKSFSSALSLFHIISSVFLPDPLV